jgi:hypothetical protein
LNSNAGSPLASETTAIETIAAYREYDRELAYTQYRN